MPAALASRVSSIFESRRLRNSTGGSAMSTPSSFADFLGFFIEHDEQQLGRTLAGLADAIDDFLVLQHVVAHVFHGFEFGVGFFRSGTKTRGW